MPKRISKSKPQPKPITIVIDRRERLPWTWRAQRATLPIRFKKASLKTGDYTLKGFESLLCLERKGRDLPQSCTTRHAAFRREHERMAAMIAKGGFACVIIEETLESVCARADKNHPGDGNRIRGTLTSWSLQYKVPWIFCGSREEAQKIALDLMTKWQKQRER